MLQINPTGNEEWANIADGFILETHADLKRCYPGEAHASAMAMLHAGLVITAETHTGETYFLREHA